jgi:hypothetical protein
LFVVKLFITFIYLDTINDLLDRSIKNRVDVILNTQPGIRRTEVIEKIINENPLNKSNIIKYMKESYFDHVEYVRSKLDEKNVQKFEKALTKEDFKDLESLSENISVDKINAATILNASHNNLLSEIKRKSSMMSINNSSSQTQHPDVNVNNSSSQTQHHDDTMNLFE